MKHLLKRFRNYIEAKHKEKQLVNTIYSLEGFGIRFVNDTSITLGCFSSNFTNNKKPVLLWKDTPLMTKERTGDLRDFIKDVYLTSRKRKIPPSKYLDELAESIKINNLRKAALTKWEGKFKKLYSHLEGELILQRASRRSGQQILKGAGGHSFHTNGLNFKVRRYLTQPIDDKPFDVLISVKYKNGEFLDKVAKSTMFPKNWGITRMNEEIALIYDEAVRLEKQFDYIQKNSLGTFKIKIEFDSFGNITNAYPII